MNDVVMLWLQWHVIDAAAALAGWGVFIAVWFIRVASPALARSP